MSETIIVTGFGPFDEHKINISWEAVKLLPKKIHHFNIIREEITVSYEYVDKKIPLLWKTYNPKLVVHVGVKNSSDKITIETCARRKGYEKEDCNGNCKEDKKVCTSEEGEDCIFAGLNGTDICDHINMSRSNMVACTSIDAGKYLCEYTFYKSLNIDKKRVIFVHVPPLNKPFSIEEIVVILMETIDCSLKQLNLY